MNAEMDADGRGLARSADDDKGPEDKKSSDLDDSWFKFPKPATIPPQPRSEPPPPPSLDDGLADDWFR
jgi:hypothetical protein